MIIKSITQVQPAHAVVGHRSPQLYLCVAGLNLPAREPRSFIPDASVLQRSRAPLGDYMTSASGLQLSLWDETAV